MIQRPNCERRLKVFMRVCHSSDGRPYVIRAIRPEDRNYLVLGLGRMSLETRYNRFHNARTEFSEQELDFLVHCDGKNHIALVAMPLGHDGQECDGVGVTRFYRDSGDPEWGEVAIVIIDEWQGMGIGNELLRSLADACRATGVVGWRANIKPDNERAIRLFSEVGPVIERSQEGETLTLSIVLDRHIGSISQLFQ